MTAQKSKPVKARTRKVDVSRALALRIDNNLSYKQIGDIQNVSAQAIHSAIAHILPDQDTELYKANRADILSKLQYKLISKLDDPTIKNMVEKHPGSAALWFNSAYNNERLERNLATDHVVQLNLVAADLRGIKPRDDKP